MSAVQDRAFTACYHCGESCDDKIVFRTHNFCCNGCKTVFEILEENNLGSYYTLNAAPGLSLKNNAGNEKFAWLDDEKVKAKLTSFNEGNLSRVTFYMPQIHCSSCIFLLENLYKLREGIKQTSVNFTRREANITFNSSEISLRQVVETLAMIGYEPHLSFENITTNRPQTHLRAYYLKIGVAFFCFGNIMLLSFPEYLGIDALTESPLRKFFGYLNFLLALPVLFFCSREFFVSAYGALKQKTLNMDFPIVLGIMAMFIRSSYEIFSHTGAGYFDTMASLVMLMLIGRLFQNKTYDTLSFERDYKSYFPVAVNVVKNGTETSIPLTNLHTGDRLVIRNMELIPADSILLKGAASIDYSFVTGEATPMAKTSGEIIYAGGRHLGSAIEVEVTRDVSHSYLTQLWNDSAFGKKSAENLSSLATRVSRWFTPAVILIATAALAYWWNKDMAKALNAFTSVLIITCPCALALSSPFTLGNMLRILSKAKIYLKNASIIERLAAIDTVVFDKTGTLTSTKDAKVEFNLINGVDEISLYQWQLIKSLVYHSSHPLSKKVYNYLGGVSVIPTADFKESEGLGIEGWVDDNCVRVGSKRYLCGINEAGDVKASDFRHASKVYVGINRKVLGYFLVKNVYRPGFDRLIASLRSRVSKTKKHYEVFVVSGDNEGEKEFLKKHVAEKNLVFNQQPKDKLEIVKELQSYNMNVLMMGDGLNDAGALKQADVGIAVSDDVNNFSPACDGIIDATAFERIDTLLTFSKTGVNIIKASFILSLMYNVLGISLAVGGTMNPLVAAVLMPVSSITIILFTTLVSTYAARRVGF
jgi:Cu+-exporting ATPase